MHHLDSARLFTRGTPLTLRNLISGMSPAHSVLTLMRENRGSSSQFAQLLCRQNAERGQLSFVLGNPESDSYGIMELLEEMIREVGEWGVFHLLADLPEGEPFMEAFSSVGFRVWAHQRVYAFDQKELTQISSEEKVSHHWRTWTQGDMATMQQLHRLVVPGLFQSIEPITRRARLGLVAYDDKQSLLGFADLDSGPKGVWVQPTLVPTMSDPAILSDLLSHLPEVFGRPVYLAVRSYQPWTQSMAEQLNFSHMASQTLVVRYLAKPKLATEFDREYIFDAALPHSGRSHINQLQPTEFSAQGKEGRVD